MEAVVATSVQCHWFLGALASSRLLPLTLTELTQPPLRDCNWRSACHGLRLCQVIPGFDPSFVYAIESLFRPSSYDALGSNRTTSEEPPQPKSEVKPVPCLSTAVMALRLRKV